MFYKGKPIILFQNMKPIKSLLFGIFGLLLLSACDDDVFGIKGEGPVVNEYRSVHDFQEIELAVSATVFLSQGPKEEIRIEAQENILNNLETHVQGSTLKIKFDKNVRKHSHIRIWITSPEINGIAVSGSGSFKGANKIESDFLSVNVSGSGDVELELEAEQLHTAISGSGKCDYSGMAEQHTITISGSGNVHGYDLQTKRSNVHVAGSGNAQVWTSERLDVQISGSGNVIYKGSPTTINSHISGSGKVRAY